MSLASAGRSDPAPGRLSAWRGGGPPGALADALSTPRGALVVAAVMTLVALATRWPLLGDPAVSMDEQFYIVVGDRMWRGALPFVDIWDRKPIGLFLIYAATRPFSADGVLSSQLAAAACAAATGWVIQRLAGRVVGPWPALAAGVVYLLYLPLLDGEAGQSPVFYNLLTALAGLCAMRASEATDRGRFLRLALAAMVLCGLAIQVKYTAVFEGAAIGLWLVAQLWRRSEGALRVVAPAALGWMAVGAAPTLAAWGAYALAGHGAAFVHANFVSIFQVGEPPGSPTRILLVLTLMLFAPIAIGGALGALRLARRRQARAPLALLIVWAAATVVETFALGHAFTHYALPALVPLSILAAATMTAPAAAALGLGLLVAANVLVTGYPSTARRDRAVTRLDAMAAATTPYARLGCLYVNDGPPIVYVRTGACLASPYVFPGHLNDANETAATDAPAAMVRLLATRPAAILVADRPLIQPRNMATAALLNQALATGYRREPLVLPDVIEGRRQILYVRDDLP